MAITKFDKVALRVLRTDIEAALAMVGKTHGITIDVGTIRFDASEFTTKITAKTKAAMAEEAGVPAGVNPTWIKAFKVNASWLGLKVTDLGKTINLNGKEYVVVGARPNARLPIVAQRASGAFIAVSAEKVVELLA